jgi:hypothetical protein
MSKTTTKAGNAWAVARDAARNFAADCLDPTGDGSVEQRNAYLNDIIEAVRAQSRIDPDEQVADRIVTERIIAVEAGYLFGVALAGVLRGPWDALNLWEPER